MTGQSNQTLCLQSLSGGFIVLMVQLLLDTPNILQDVCSKTVAANTQKRLSSICIFRTEMSPWFRFF